jgi:molybdate transport system permease protein
MDSTDLAAVWLTLKLATVVTLLLLVYRHAHRLVAGPHALGLQGRGRRRRRAAAGPAAYRHRLLPARRHGAERTGRPADPVARPRPVALHLPWPGHRLGVLFAAFRRPADPERLRGDRRTAAGGCRDLRASPWDAFWSVAVPLAKPGFLSGAILGFAHTVGEFGIVLMIGGNIPENPRRLGADLRPRRGAGVHPGPLAGRRHGAVQLRRAAGAVHLQPGAAEDA